MTFFVSFIAQFAVMAVLIPLPIMLLRDCHAPTEIGYACGMVCAGLLVVFTQARNRWLDRIEGLEKKASAS